MPAAPSSARPPISPRADKMLYAIRDVTGTVESIPLITASILSVRNSRPASARSSSTSKTGSGAFMPTLEKSRALAESLVSVANGAGLKTAALITDMNEPLATAAGNALEIRNAVDFLTGAHQDPRLREVTLALCAAALELTSYDGRCQRCRRDAPSTAARPPSISPRWSPALGGPADFVERMDAHLSPAPIVRDILAPAAGYVTAIDTRGVGMGVVALGGGRRLPTDNIDHRRWFRPTAWSRGKNRRSYRVVPRSCSAPKIWQQDATQRLLAAYTISDAPAPSHPLIADRIGAP